MFQKIQKAQQIINDACKRIAKPVNIMEVCGTHTVAIFRSGIRSTLPENLKLLSGPGCPVCVTDQSYIDTMLDLAQRNECIVATYGDMIRVPGSAGSLEKLHRPNVRIVLSSDQAIQLAQNNPEKTVVFIAVGFETTTPATAVAIAQAEKLNLINFCVLIGHKLVVPAMDALLSDKNNKIDAFLCPGHVSVIIGSDAYAPVVKNFAKPCVVAGFEPLQIIDGIAEICSQLADNNPKVALIYHAAVTPGGNKTAQNLIAQYFQPCDGPWRGLGNIPQASLKLKPAYEKYDALKRFNIEQTIAPEPPGCQCGRVLCGLIEPPDCPLFAKTCTPDDPVGPCMVSHEGSCAAWYKYSQH